MRRVLCYFVPFYLSFWCLGRSVPGIGVSTSLVATSVLFLLSVLVFWERSLYLRHQAIFAGFIFIHVISLVPFGPNNIALRLDLVAHICAAFLFFVIVANLPNNLDRYSRMLGVLLGTTTGLMLFLLFMHLVVFESQYLTGHLTYSEWYYSGRFGKNTLALFLAMLFPFAYARFTHHRNAYNFLLVAVIAGSALYTLSRMALVGLVVSILVFAGVGLRTARYRRQLVVGFLVLVVILPLQYSVNPLDEFLKLRSPTEVGSIESGDVGFLQLGGARGSHLRNSFDAFTASPVVGNGLGASRADGRSETHNDHLKLLQEFGLVGFCLFWAIVWFSLRDLRSCRRLIGPEHAWLLDGQIVALVSTVVMMGAVNAYDTIPFWFILAGAQVIPLTLKKRHALRSLDGDSRGWSHAHAG